MQTIDTQAMKTETFTDLETSTLPQVDQTLETWLAEQTATQPDVPIRWSRTAQRVRNAEHLCVLIAQLTTPGEFGVVERLGAPHRWGQTMRHPAGFIVEVHTGSPDDVAQRVYRGDIGEYPRPSGDRAAFPFELWTPMSAAEGLWGWLTAGVLPIGCNRTTRHMISGYFDHGLGRGPRD